MPCKNFNCIIYLFILKSQIILLNYVKGTCPIKFWQEIPSTGCTNEEGGWKQARKKSELVYLM